MESISAMALKIVNDKAAVSSARRLTTNIRRGFARAFPRKRFPRSSRRLRATPPPSARRRRRRFRTRTCRRQKTRPARRRRKPAFRLRLLCLDSNCSFGKIPMFPNQAIRKLCLDSNCSFGKMRLSPWRTALWLCLDSNCSFGKIEAAAGLRRLLALP